MPRSKQRLHLESASISYRLPLVATFLLSTCDCRLGVTWASSSENFGILCTAHSCKSSWSEPVWPCWLTGLFTLCSWPFPTWLPPHPPYSHLHRSQHSLRLRICFKSAASLHNGGQVPPVGTACFEHSTRTGLNFKHGASCLWVWPRTKGPVISFPASVESCWFSRFECCSCKKESYMACISLQATPSTPFSQEDRQNGSIHNALKWKSGLISLSKGSHLPTENIIQPSAGKESGYFKHHCWDLSVFFFFSSFSF